MVLVVRLRRLLALLIDGVRFLDDALGLPDFVDYGFTNLMLVLELKLLREDISYCKQEV